MSYIRTIAATIDAAVELALNTVPNKAMNGLAQLLPRQKDGGLELLPFVVTPQGEGTYIGPDDDFTFSSYHRLLGIDASKSPVPGYGRNKADDKHITRMCYVAFVRWDTSLIALDDMCVKLHAAFPEAISGQFPSEIVVTGINTNILQIYSEEQPNSIQFYLKPEQYLIKILYSIESTFNRKCLTN